LNEKLQISELKKICQSPEKDKNFYIAPLTRRISIRLTSLLIRTNITANQLSGFSILLGVFGSILFLFGNLLGNIAGSLVLFLFVITDTVDGELARYYRHFGKHASVSLGRFCELMQHMIVMPLFFICLSFGLFNTGNGLITFVFGFGATFSFLLCHIMGFFSSSGLIATDPFDQAEFLKSNKMKESNNRNRIRQIIASRRLQKLMYNLLSSSLLPIIVFVSALLGILNLVLFYYSFAFFVLTIVTAFSTYSKLKSMTKIAEEIT
jgi:phosphatidylglycerophosphate synthase